MRLIDDDLEGIDRETLITEASGCDWDSASTVTVQVMNFVEEARAGKSENPD